MRFIYVSITNTTCDAVHLRVHHQRDLWHDSFSRVCHQHGSPMAIRLTELLGSAIDPLRQFSMVRSTSVDSQASTINAFHRHSSIVGSLCLDLETSPSHYSNLNQTQLIVNSVRASSGLISSEQPPIVFPGQSPGIQSAAAMYAMRLLPAFTIECLRFSPFSKDPISLILVRPYVSARKERSSNISQ